MKILISSHAFAPSIGGIETVSRLLAEEFVRRGNEVMVVTQTPAADAEQFSFPVLRRPSLGSLWRALRWCDVFWQNNLSLRTFWPAILARSPIVVTHQGSYCRRPRGLDLVQRIKHAVVRRTTSVAISAAVAACFDVRSKIIPNPFDARLFAPGSSTSERPNELVFVGRLVSEKGLDVLLRALAELRARRILASLTIVGAGPELTATQELATRLDLGKQVIFRGAQRGSDLAATLQEHKILVVPSRYDEPFGVVALEGIASGCVAIGSRGGGLPEAIGPCGRTFPNGDHVALAEAIERLLHSPNECAQLLAAAPEHLAQFHPAVIAGAYLDLFESKLR
jgi:glycosyltransferase involved in cell wall biosynthesis